MKYIEFKHEQSDWTTGKTFTDISLNDRYIMFEIITENFFEYDGWYSYYLFEDDSKEILIDYGKLLVKNDIDKLIYSNTDKEKIIYNR